MKRTLLFLILFISCYSFLVAQKYELPKINGQTITTCSGTLTSGATCFGNYCPGADITVTFCTGDSQKRLVLNFNYSDFTLAKGDELYVYDGQNTTAILMHRISKTNVQVSIKASGSCMTLHFVTASSSKGGYWEATISCQDIPQAPSDCNGNKAATDHCADAPTLCNLNGYCGNTSDYYTADLLGNMCEECSLFGGTIQNNSWLKFKADSTAASLQLTVSNCSQNRGIQFGVYSGTDCNNFVRITDSLYTGGSVFNGSNTGFTVNVPFGSAPPLVKGQDYYIMVDGMSGDVCDYVINALKGVFVIDAGRDRNICEGQHIQMKASGGNSYLWSPSDGLSASDISNPIASPTVSTTYTVTFTGGNPNCPQEVFDQVIVNVLSQVQQPVVAPSAPGVCIGSSIQLDALTAGANAYLWTPTNGLNNNKIYNPKASPVETTTYTLIVSDTANNTVCSNQTTKVIVKVNPLPLAGIGINPPDKSLFCHGESVSLYDSQLPTPDSRLTYQWFSNQGQITGATNSGFNAVNNSVVGGLSTIGYYLVVTDSNNCFNTSNVIRLISDNLTATLQGDRKLCFNSSGSFSPYALGKPPYTYTWYKNDSLINIKSYVNKNKYTKNDIFKVLVTDSNKCTATDTIIIYEVGSEFSYTPKKDTTGFSPFLVPFKFNGNVRSIKWDFGDGTSDDKLHTAHSYIFKPTNAGDSTTVYHASIIIDDASCLDSIPIDIIVKPPHITKISNIITPGQDGKNDYFQFNGSGISSAEVIIYTRWGNIISDKTYVFNQSETEYKTWDASNASDGAYFYVIKPYDNIGNIVRHPLVQLSGTLTVIRSH